MTGYKGRTKRGFELPEVINPETTMCVQFRIPNAPEYRRAVLGWVHELGKWYLWEKSAPGDTRAKEAAQLFRLLLGTSLEILDECGSEEMPFQLRQNSENNCLLEQSIDGGVNWMPAFDYSLCSKGTPLIRFTENADMEVSYDGGETWQPATTEDPRLNAPIFTPIPGADGDAKRCEAARNATALIKDEVDKMIADASAWSSLSGLTALFLGILVTIGIIGSGGALAPLMLTIAAGLLGIGSTAFAAAFTSQVWDDYLCILYCNFGQDGKVTEAQFEIIKAEVQFQIGGIAGDHLVNVMNLMGLIGFNNAAQVPQNDIIGDCSICTACSCDPTCHDINNYDGEFNAQANVTGDDSKWSGGWGFRTAGTYGRVYGVLSSFDIDLGADVCLAGVIVWGGGSSDNGWSSGYDVYLDGQWYGEYTQNLSNIFQPFVWTQNGVIPATKKHGRYLRFIAKQPQSGNLTTPYGYSIKAVKARYCNL